MSKDTYIPYSSLDYKSFEDDYDKQEFSWYDGPLEFFCKVGQESYFAAMFDMDEERTRYYYLLDLSKEVKDEYRKYKDTSEACLWSYTLEALEDRGCVIKGWTKW